MTLYHRTFIAKSAKCKRDDSISFAASTSTEKVSAVIAAPVSEMKRMRNGVNAQGGTSAGDKKDNIQTCMSAKLVGQMTKE